MYRSVNTERQGHYYSDEHGGSAQHQGIRKTLHEGLEYIPLGHIGLTHITSQHAFHIVSITYDKRIIQSKVFTDLLNLFRLCVITRKH